MCGLPPRYGGHPPHLATVIDDEKMLDVDDVLRMLLEL